MTRHKSISFMRHLAMMLLTVLVFTGCSKSDDDDNYLNEDEFLKQFNVKVKDLYGSWKIVKFIDSDGKTYDFNLPVFIKDLSTCEESLSVEGDFPNGYDLQVIEKEYEDAVIFNYPSNVKSSSLLFQVIKKKSSQFFDGSVYVLTLINSIDVGEMHQMDIYGLAAPKLEGKTIKSAGSWTRASYGGGTTENFTKNGTFIMEKI